MAIIQCVKQETSFVYTNKLKYLFNVPKLPLVEFLKYGPSIRPSSNLTKNHIHPIGVGIECVVCLFLQEVQEWGRIEGGRRALSLSSKENTLLLSQATKEKVLFLLSEPTHRNKIITHTHVHIPVL